MLKDKITIFPRILVMSLARPDGAKMMAELHASWFCLDTREWRVSVFLHMLT